MAGRERLTLAAVLGWCTAIALIDAFVVDGAVLIGLLITGPLLAAVYGSSRTTAIAGAYAVLLGLLLGFPDDMFLAADHVVRVVIVAIGSGLAVWLARTREGLERARYRRALVAD